MWLVIGLGLLGFLVGNLISMTSEAVVANSLCLFFALIGGSVVTFVNRIPDSDRNFVGKLMLALCGGSLLGIYLGIAVTEHQWLTPRQYRHVTSPATADENSTKYLKGQQVDELNAIIRLHQTGQYTDQQEIDALVDLIRTQNGGSR